MSNKIYSFASHLENKLSESALDSSSQLRKLAGKFEKKLEDKKETKNKLPKEKKEKKDKEVKRINKAKKKADKAQKKLDKKLASIENHFIKIAGGITKKIKFYDDNGEKVKLKVPAKYIICPECEGAGEVVDEKSLENSSDADSTAEEIVKSHKVIDCDHCKGKGTHKVIDPERASEEEMEAYEKCKLQKEKEEGEEAEEAEEEHDEEDDENLGEDGLEKNAHLLSGLWDEIHHAGESITDLTKSGFDLMGDDDDSMISKLKSSLDHLHQLTQSAESEEAEDLEEAEEEEEDNDDKVSKIKDSKKKIQIINQLAQKASDKLNMGSLEEAAEFLKPLSKIFEKASSSMALEELGMSELLSMVGEIAPLLIV